MNELALHRVIGRRNVGTADFARGRDFDIRLEGRYACLHDVPGWNQYLAYCVDSARGVVMLVSDGAAAVGARDATFLYEWQRSRARFLLEVPIERVPEIGDASGMSPCFIISSGRTGSTLLVQMLRALGKPVMAEPDSLTSIALAKSTARLDECPPGAAALRACVGNAQLAWGACPYIKLRGVCSNLVADLAAALPSARFVFVMRERRAWARSHGRAFGIRADAMAEVLLDTVMGYDRLTTQALHPALIWYEDLCGQPLATLAAVGETPVNVGAITRVLAAMSVDVQEGTPLARSELSRSRVTEESLAAFDAAWEARKPRALLERHGLHRLL